MHTHSHDENSRDSEPTGHWIARSFHLWAELADNPVCWLKGHTPRVRVKTPACGDPWVLIDCRVCGRRYDWETAKGLDRAGHKAMTAQRIEVIERIGAQAVAQAVEKRQHWARRSAEFGASVYVGPPSNHVHLAGLGLSIGGLGSETPFDLDVHLPGLSLYLKTSLGRRVAEMITRGNGTREFDAHISKDHGRGPITEVTARLTVWGRKGETRTADPWWVKGKHWDLNPLDRWWGQAKYEYQDVAGPVRCVLRMPEGDEHWVDLTLRRETFGRPRGGAQHKSWSVQWRCEDGIPFRSDSWKGDNVYASGVTVSADAVDRGRWSTDAIAKITAKICESRSRYGWKASDVAPGSVAP